MLPICEICGLPITGKRANSRVHYGRCFAAHEAKQTRAQYAKYSPERRRCIDVTARAITAGKLIRQPCEICGATRSVDAHHDDYSRPLDVRWLCRSHHRRLHVELSRHGAPHAAPLTPYR